MRLPRGTTGLIGDVGLIFEGEVIVDALELELVRRLQMAIDHAPPVTVLEPSPMDELVAS